MPRADIADTSSSLEHPAVLLTPNRRIPFFAMTAASAIAIALMALKTPELQDAPASNAIEAHGAVESAVETARLPTHSAGVAAVTAADESSSLANTVCPEGYEPQLAARGEAVCVLITAPPSNQARQH